MTVPATCAGVVAVITFALLTFTFVAATPPTATVAPATKLVPLIVIGTPPAAGPTIGAVSRTIGPPPPALFTVNTYAPPCSLPYFPPTMIRYVVAAVSGAVARDAPAEQLKVGSSSLHASCVNAPHAPL